MKKKITRGNLKKRKVSFLILAFFIVMTSFLLTVSINLGLNVFFSVDLIMEKAQTPHLMQMHKGEIEIKKLDAFVKDNPNVEKYQNMEFINFKEQDIKTENGFLTGTSQDNGLIGDDMIFDYLLDDNNEIIKVNKGEIYVPSMYKDRIKVGSVLNIAGKDFIVKGRVRDSQMNSPLASSKRFLVNSRDLKVLEDKGVKEYLIGFRLKDDTKVGELQKDYSLNNLPSNGPSITYKLFKLMNSITEGSGVLISLFTSIIALIISLLAMNLIVKAQIMEDIKEIGMMKALGLKQKNISSIYRYQYGLIALPSLIMGFILAFLSEDIYLNSIRDSFGTNDKKMEIILLSIVPLIILLGFLYFSLRVMLRTIIKIHPVKVLRGEYEGSSKPSLLRVHGRNLRFILNNYFSSLKMYLPMIILITLSVFMITAPSTLLDTTSKKEFAMNLGVPVVDLIGTGSYTEKDTDKINDLINTIKKRDEIKNYGLFYSFNMQTIKDNKTMNLFTMEGDQSSFPITYIEGNSPKKGEVALSKLLMEEEGLKIGDYLKTEEFGVLKIVGAFSDVTNGGKTAKINEGITPKKFMAINLFINLKNEKDEEFLIESFKDNENLRLKSVTDFMQDTLKPTLVTLNSGVVSSAITSALIIFLIAYLFLLMIMEKEKSSLMTISQLGIRENTIKIDYTIRNLITVLISCIIAWVLTMTLGETLVSSLFSILGTGRLKFSAIGINTLIFGLGIVTISLLIATVLGLKQVGKYRLNRKR